MKDKPHVRWIEPEAVLAIGSFLVFSFVALVVLFHLVPPENEKYAMLMLGALIGLVKDTFARYFSSTKGAADQRTELIDLAKSVSQKES